MDKPKGKRKIPDGLVHEIGEYSALLRTLSIGTTSDLAGQLLRHEQERRGDEGSAFGDSDDESMYSQSIDASSPPPPTSPFPTSSPLTASPSRSCSSLLPSSPPLPSRKRKLSAPAESSARKRRAMVGLTRWPLLLEDVPKPEWTLEDEVGAMMSQLRVREEGEEDEGDLEDCVPSATLSTAHVLESLLGTIAGTRLVARIFMDPKAVSMAERRLQAMYGASTATTATETPMARRQDKDKLMDEILYLPEGDPPRAPEPEVRGVKRRNKPEGEPRRKYEWRDGRKLKRDLRAAAKAKKESEWSEDEAKWRFCINYVE
ncbi:hypothetical protein BDZ89DRAFT_1130767 [Hymenopellis radicata]|nr:hypothetical protein BDZ89DRAFT_1130767 [Hymenopellis radicata]